MDQRCLKYTDTSPLYERSSRPIRLQRFTADFRDLTSWVTEMQALINADELANDVAGAEALLDRHQEHKVKTSLIACWSPDEDFLQKNR